MESVLLIEGWFDEAHPRFLDELFAARDTGPLRPLARRWVVDGRPWSRARLHDYIEDGCDRPGHRALVKALYKTAEEKGNLDLVGRFLVVFDRMAPRRLVEEPRWDYTEVVLRPDPQVPAGLRRAEQAGRFTRRTRLYLARRALRCLRHLGFRDPAGFRDAAVATLCRYEDTHLQTPEHLLDAWGLHHLLYGRSPVLDRQMTGTVPAEGHVLAELAPAPLHPDVWLGGKGRAALLELLTQAEAAVVRGWAAVMLRRDHDLAALTLLEVRYLLHSPHDEAQQLGAERLPGLDLNRLSLAGWLDLLNAKGEIAVRAVASLAAQHVDPTRLSLPECVRLARLPAAPVAALGLRWARGKDVDAHGGLPVVLPLSGARVQAVRVEAADWLAGLLLTSPGATPLHLRDLVDAPHADVRARALALLDTPRYRDAEVVWAALPETPFAEVRVHLLRHVEQRKPALDVQRRLWADTLLALSGGGARGRAIRQIGARLEAHPDEASALLRLLAVALRGVSAPDQRLALSVLGCAVLRHPALRAAVQVHLPEVGLFPEIAA